jgi:hypothetical protein
LDNGAIKPVRTSYTKWLGLFRKYWTGFALPVDGWSISPVNNVLKHCEAKNKPKKLKLKMNGGCQEIKKKKLNINESNQRRKTLQNLRRILYP